MNAADQVSRPCARLGRRLGALVLMTMCGTALAGAESSGPPVDHEITAAVREALQYDTAIPANQINAETNDGIATLTGQVGDLLTRERVAKTASRVQGVRSVVNQINVNAESRPDGELQRDVEQALLFDAATDSFEITPTAKNGKVTLAGTVDSWQEEQLVLHVVKGVRGVREIVDNIEIAYQTDRLDREIQAEVARALDIDAWVTEPEIEVEVRSGTVFLSGTVDSLAEKERAMSIAWVAGVKDVNVDRLTVDPWTDEEQDRTAASPPRRTDQQIAEAVRDAFRNDPRVQAFKPEVVVTNGIVMLSGTVDNLGAKQAADQDARNTVGVRRVINHLLVAPEDQYADDQVARNVVAALTRSVVTEAYEIDVKVEDGVATLSGSVDTFIEKSEAERIAQRANGVIDVRNSLEVTFPSYTYYDYDYDPLWDYDPYYFSAPSYGMNRPPAYSTWPYTNDAEVKDDIEDELVWSPFVDEDEVNVSVENGVATLTGRVDTWSEFRAATENAYEGGARWVVNNLGVQ